jgi:hypothetical protein
MHRLSASKIQWRVRCSILYRMLAIGAVSALAACGGDGAATYSVAGSISGLSGSGLVLQNKGGDDLSVSTNASAFKFPTSIVAGGSYNVIVAKQPDGLSCSVTNGAGSNIQAVVTNISVACSPITHSIAGTVTGLTASGLILQNNGADTLAVATNATSFQFATPVIAGGIYNVTVATQPAGRTCTVTNGSGSNVQAVVTNINVACDPVTHTIGGTITGLTTSGLILQNNGADNLAVAGNAIAFQFATPVAVGGGYSVTVFSQPSGLTCSVSNAAGTRVTADISGIQITCSPRTLSIGGTIAGLMGSGLVLQDNGGDNLSIVANATGFQFAMPVAYGGVYAASVLTQPAGQNCSVSQGTGIATTSVATVALTCANIITYTVTASNGANGSIAPSGAVVVNGGGGQAFVATPITGYAISQWLLDGTPVQIGGDVFTLSNITASHTLEVTFAQTTLTPSVVNLALSVNCLPSSSCTSMQSTQLTGTSRQIAITNTGTIAATGVSVAFPTWPAGTTASTNCGSVMAASSSCQITITPGSEASSNCTMGAAPTSATITISAGDANTSQVGVAVLGYGCIYQGGYIFSVDDTTPNTGGIGGKVAALTDQSTGIIWSSNGSSGGDNTNLLGIDETSTTSSPSPTSPAYPAGTPAYLACNGSSDGACNTSDTLSYYNFNRTAGGAAPTPLTQYAAGVCDTTISGYSDWYLPAICELGYDNYTSGSSCGTASAPNQQNMQSNLVGNNNVGSLAGMHWSSSEYSHNPQYAAWLQSFASGGGSSQFSAGKDNAIGVRCSRALSP